MRKADTCDIGVTVLPYGQGPKGGAMLKFVCMCYIIRLDAADERYRGGRKALIEECENQGWSFHNDEDLLVLRSFYGYAELLKWDVHFYEKGLNLFEVHQKHRFAGDRVHYTPDTGWSEPCNWLGQNEFDSTMWLWKDGWENSKLVLDQKWEIV
jgi:hypothetical protein